MIKVLINGFDGKMGQEVFTQIQSSTNFQFIGGVDKFKNISDITEQPDVIIDFSRPEATINILKYALEFKIPTVIATTGLSDMDFEFIKKCSLEIPIFQSANMSYEMNLMLDLVSELAKKLSDSDIEIVEIHHNRKVDCPSGTAFMLANSINDALSNKMVYEFNRHDKREKRNKNEIGIHSIRGGTEVGKHTVYFFGENESFEITHSVTSRSIFAKGALKAAKFIVSQQPGFYNMKNLI